MRARFLDLYMGAAVVLAVFACGETTGGCVIPSVLGSRYDHCVNDDTRAECDDVSGKWHGGNTCGGLGFTKVCADDPPNTYRAACP